MRIDGPYGKLSIHLPTYPSLLLLGGGVGVTPLTSILRWMKEERKVGGLPLLNAVALVWVVRDVVSRRVGGWVGGWLRGQSVSLAFE